MLHVNVVTGDLCHFAVDFSLPGFLPFDCERKYRSQSNQDSLIGRNWSTPLDSHLDLQIPRVVYQDPRGAQFELECREPAGHGLIGASNDRQYLLFRDEDRDGDCLILATPNRTRVHFRICGRLPRTLRPSRIEDLNGNALTFQYDDQGRLQLLVDTLARKLHVSHTTNGRIREFKLVAPGEPEGDLSLALYNYDAFGNLISVTDACGGRVSYEYRDDLIVRCTNKLGGSHYAEYDPLRRCIRTWQEKGVRTRMLSYDDKRRLTTVTDSLGYTTLYRWNEAGLITDQVDPLGGKRTNLLDDKNGLIATLDENGYATPAAFEDRDRRILTVIDAAGATTVFKDNDAGQVESKTDAVGATWHWRYDAHGNLVAFTLPSGGETRFTYDSRGFLVTITDPRGRAVRQSLSPDGKRLTVSDELGIISDYQYDELGSMVSAADGAGARHTMRRDALGRLRERRWPDGASRSFGYDAEGNLVLVVDELKNRTRFVYDSFGKCLEYIGPMGTIVRYQYDSEENPIAIVNEAGEEHRFSYDAKGRVVQQVFFDGTEENYGYDERGKIVTVVDGEGGRTDLVYNEVRCITEKRYPDGTWEKLSYDGLRRLVDLANGSVELHLEWDVDGNLVEVKQGESTLRYTYDEAGNRLTLEDDGGRVIRHEYDSRGRLISLDDNATGLHRFDYDGGDRVKRQAFPNGAVLSYEYDLRGRITRQRLAASSGNAIVKTYQYDPLDRLVAMDEGEARILRLQYDEGQKLLSLRTDHEAVEQYRYDQAGNMVYSSSLGQLSYASGNRLAAVSGGRCEYDKRGALVRGEHGERSLKYEYDGAGRLVKAVQENGSETVYGYDPFGRRLTKTRNGETTRFLWDGFTLLQEVGPEGRTHFLFDQNGLLPLSQARGQDVDHFATDRRGCVFATTGQHAEITGVYRYSGFGLMREESQPDRPRHPFRLRGQYYDEETGLHYNLHRYYEPATGRFLARDPLGINAGRNLYQYGPNPITWEDPFGLSSECQGDVFYRAMSDKEKKKVWVDCQLHAKQSKCPEGPYVTKKREEAEGKVGTGKKGNQYKHLVEICTKPGTTNVLQNSPLACRNGSQAAQFPGLPDVVSGNVNRIEHKMENGTLNYGLSRGEGLDTFNDQVESMKIVGTNETCTRSS